MHGRKNMWAHIISVIQKSVNYYDNCSYFMMQSVSYQVWPFQHEKEKKEMSIITTSYVHCVTQGFFFVIGRCVSLGSVSLLMLATQQVLTTDKHTHIHHNGQSTFEPRPDKAFCCLSFLFSYSQTQKITERRFHFQLNRRVSSFSHFLYIYVEWIQHSGER